jgi:hypothetical protein
MRGSVVKRGNGYSVVVELDRDPGTGKRRQKWHSGYRTRRDAERALAEMIDAVNRGSYVPKTRQMVAEFAAEWLAAIEPTVRPATHYSYSRNLKLHVLPYVGARRCCRSTRECLTVCMRSCWPTGARIRPAAAYRPEAFAISTQSSTGC